MVNLTKEEKTHIKQLNERNLDAIRAAEITNSSLVHCMLVLYQKYKINKDEFGIDPDKGIFVKKSK